MLYVYEIRQASERGSTRVEDRIVGVLLLRSVCARVFLYFQHICPPLSLISLRSWFVATHITNDYIWRWCRADSFIIVHLHLYNHNRTHTRMFACSTFRVQFSTHTGHWTRIRTRSRILRPTPPSMYSFMYVVILVERITRCVRCVMIGWSVFRLDVFVQRKFHFNYTCIPMVGQTIIEAIFFESDTLFIFIATNCEVFDLDKKVSFSKFHHDDGSSLSILGLHIH